MRMFVRPLILGLVVVSSPAWSAVPRPVSSAPVRATAAAETPPAASAAADAVGDALAVPLPATLQSGMSYRAFAQTVMEQGWQPADPLAADSCMAAGDCEIEFVAPTPGTRLRVQIGSQAGAAVVQRWATRPVTADRIAAGTASAAAGTTPAPTAATATSGAASAAKDPR
ncbi:hypothetical protein [Xanthomonas campestris]|uniref:hypothetical protein n=1 Tax=Xanthomonas campestris TaxID=339 RepID=UPI000E0F82AD|nr:hypothetical protein [Xanthomonas campestris]MEA9491250.1 hypothetical protein [Xanthomonas campestris]MEA9509787.1 hypothetical protein [Xanthomonas campestris]MEA9576794.1 hypothetical protein [Xanthomonas campestris]MEB2110511.1 hypothetical protein [Xanthomonas campestris pv. campestris]RFF70918.1 hypothetical protein D0A39_13005 [Xanthomonas campestris pv. campestris]